MSIVDKSFIKNFVERVIEKVYDGVKYTFICKEHSRKITQDSKIIGINVLFSASINKVHIIQAVPFYVTVLNGLNGNVMFSIGKIGQSPSVIHTSAIHKAKLKIDLILEIIKNNENSSITTTVPYVKDKEIVELSNIEFVFYHTQKIFVLYVCGASFVRIEYSPSINSLIYQFFQALKETIEFGILQLKN